MKREKKRTSKKDRKDKRDRRHNKTNKRARKNKGRSKSRSKSRSKRNNNKSIQKGGAGLLPAIGVGLIATSIAAAAYKGFRLINKIKDKADILKLLNKDYIEYSPKVVVTETSDFMNYYLQCVSTYEFFHIALFYH